MGYGQALQARLDLLTDSVVLGKTIEVRMSLLHSSRVAVIFPQKQDFPAPFELSRRQKLATDQRGSIIKSEMTYQVKSFGISSRQSLRLPYRFIRGKDTLEAFVSSDSLPFASRITAADSTYHFKANEGLYPLKDPPDYRWIMLVGIGGVLMIALMYALLRRPVQRWLRLRTVKKEWKLVYQKFLNLQKQMNNQALVLSQLNHIWKTYADPGGHYSLKSQTSTELPQVLKKFSYISPSHRQILLKLARTNDQVIYAGQSVEPQELTDLFTHIDPLLQELYEHWRAKAKTEIVE